MKAPMIESTIATVVRIAIILTLGIWASATMADTSLHTRTPVDNLASCDAVKWNPDMQAQFPWIKAGCREIIVQDGTKWARFNADFVRLNHDGTAVFDFKDANDKTMHRVTLKPARHQRMMIDGKYYSFDDLESGQNLHLYVPENIFAVAMAPGESREDLASVVAPTEKTEVAQVETTSTPIATQLPRTAGPLPFVLLAGLASLIGGLAMTIRRKLNS